MDVRIDAPPLNITIDGEQHDIQIDGEFSHCIVLLRVLVEL